MPSYLYSCSDCSFKDSVVLSISKYMKIKNEKNICKICNIGNMVQEVCFSGSKIKKTKTEELQDIKEDVMNTVNKIKSGDIRAALDIYGDN